MCTNCEENRILANQATEDSEQGLVSWMWREQGPLLAALGAWRVKLLIFHPDLSVYRWVYGEIEVKEMIIFKI